MPEAPSEPESATLIFALIHNHSAERNAYLLPRLARLAEQVTAPLTLFNWQPPVVSHSIWQALKRDLVYTVVAVRWCRYRGIGMAAVLHTGLSYTISVVKKYLLASAKRTRWQRVSFIETVVTAKHIRAWEAFAESGKDYLVCFEDDAIFSEETEARFSDTLVWLKQSNATEPVYVDLAGGLDVNLLGITRLFDKKVAVGNLYTAPVTNTACAYVLSREVAHRFLGILQQKPALRLIGVDWLMNTLFMDLRSNGISCRCLHTNPTVFGHGTFTGDYVSWQQKLH